MNDFEQQAEALYEAKGDLTEADMFALLQGGGVSEGDTAKAETGEPDAGKEAPKADESAASKEEKGPAEGAATDATPEEPDPEKTVILAKDGVHTIDYSKLVEAREAAKTAAAQAAEFKAEAERLRAELAATHDQAVKDSENRMAEFAADNGMTVQELFGDYSQEQLAKGVETLIEKRLAPLLAQIDQKLAPVQKAAVEDATTKHYTQIYTAHPDADSIVESEEFGQWLTGLPRVLQSAYRSTMDPAKGGAAGDVIEVFDAYRTAHPKEAAPAPAPAVPAASTGAVAKAKAALAAVKPKTPNTLSDIPAGAAAHTDEAEAIANESVESLMARMGNMKPDAIEALMARIL
jgi:hypothetical protein